MMMFEMCIQTTVNILFRAEDTILVICGDSMSFLFFGSLGRNGITVSVEKVFFSKTFTIKVKMILLAIALTCLAMLSVINAI